MTPRATTSHLYCHEESRDLPLPDIRSGTIRYICTRPRGHSGPHDWETVGIQDGPTGSLTVPL
jgi:hypothetical protein